MNKYNLMKKLASIATELDSAGFNVEAKTIDTIFVKIANDYKCKECRKKFDEEPYKVNEEGEAFCSFECREEYKRKHKMPKKKPVK
jgi:hypothetical protein